MRHLQRVPQDAEARDIGDAVHGGVLRQFRADPVQQGRGGQHLGIGPFRQGALLDSGGIDADAQPLGQDQRIARPGPGIAAHLGGMAEADHRQPVNRLQRVDGMASGHRNSGFGADRGAARQDPPDHRRFQLVDRHAQDGQGHDRLAPHRIDIRQGVGGGDPSEILRIVHHRHEEVGGGDHRQILVHLPDGGIVRGLGPDQQLLERAGHGLFGQELPQHRRGELAAATAAMGEFGQADRGIGHGSLHSAVHRHPGSLHPAIGSGEGHAGRSLPRPWP